SLPDPGALFLRTQLPDGSGGAAGPGATSNGALLPSSKPLPPLLQPAPDRRAPLPVDQRFGRGPDARHGAAGQSHPAGGDPDRWNRHYYLYELAAGPVDPASHPGGGHRRPLDGKALEEPLEVGAG